MFRLDIYEVNLESRTVDFQLVFRNNEVLKSLIIGLKEFLIFFLDFLDFSYDYKIFIDPTDEQKLMQYFDSALS